MNIGCVLMAAGTSSRFGENKLLHEIDGRSLLARVLEAAPASLFARAVAVVSRSDVEAVVRAAGYETVWNPDPAHGQGGSIALGARAMGGMDAAVFCVADQPFLTRESVRRLLAAYAPGRIAALAHNGKRGNPVLFPSECFSALAALRPDQTGRVVLSAHAGSVSLVEVSDPRELFDIDTRDDLRLTSF